MYTLYVLLYRTESNDYNEPVLIDTGLWKVTGKDEQDAQAQLTARLSSIDRAYQYTFKVYSFIPELPNNSDTIPF